MTEPAALQKLLTWLSPAFPVGAFAWSGGLESAIADRTVSDSAALQNWLEGALSHGGLKTDAIILAQAWKAGREGLPSPGPAERTGQGISLNPTGILPLAGRTGARSGALADLADLALALTPGLERHMETTVTGASFVTAARAWPSEVYAGLPDPCPYPLAVGAIAAAHDIELPDTLLAYLTVAVHSQISVAVRLVPLGQSDGLRVMAALEQKVAALAAQAANASLADIGSIAYAIDIAQMRHETLEPRIFRS